MNILITGAAGFIGRAILTESLLNKTKWGLDNITGVDWDRSLCSEVQSYLSLTDRELMCMDFASIECLTGIISKRYDCIIHLAALPRVAYSVENPRKTDENNIQKSVALLEACLSSGTPMVFASSSSVYGGAENIPTKETEPLNPVSPYALQKATFEKYLEIYEKLKKYKSIRLRFFNVYGPGQSGESAYSTVLSSWMYKLKNNLPLTIEGDGCQRRDFCYIDDVVNACLLSVTKIETIQGVFNVASGINYSCNDVLSYIKVKFGENSITLDQKPVREGDVRETSADISSIKNALGYYPQTEFWKGVDNTISWWFH